MKFNRDKCKILQLGKYNPGVQHRLGSTWLGRSSVEGGSRVLVDKLSKSKKCGVAARKANGMLSCINKGVTSRVKEAIIPVQSALFRPHLVYCVQFWSLLYQKNVERLERLLKRVTKMVKGLESLTCEEQLRELNLFSLEKRRIRAHLISVLHCLKKRETPFLQGAT